MFNRRSPRAFPVVLLALVAIVVGVGMLLSSRPRVEVATEETREASSMSMGTSPPSEVGGLDETIDGREASSDGAGPDVLRLAVEERDGEGLLAVHADEVDRCIELEGTELTITEIQSGRHWTSSIGKGGLALFEPFSIPSESTKFQIASTLPDRGCFPDEFSLTAEDFSGYPGRAGLALAIVHRHELRGVVRDAATRAPIPDAHVFVDSFTMSEARAANDGAFVLNLNEPSGSVVIRAPRYQELLWRFPEVDENGATWLPERHDFELLRDRITSFVEVRATVGGEPAAGATLIVREGGECAIPDAALASLALSERAEFLASLASEVDGLGRTTGIDDLTPEQLDGLGRAELCVRAPGRITLEVRRDDRFAIRDVEVEAGERRVVELALEEGERVDVVVTREAHPVGHFPVTLTLDAGSEETLLTNDDGVATFTGLPHGGVLVQLGELRDGSIRWVASRRRVALPGASSVERVQIDLQPATPRTGVVVSSRLGVPVRQATVRSSFDQVVSGDGGEYEVIAPDGDLLEFVASRYRSAILRVDEKERLPVVSLQSILGDGATSVSYRVADSSGAPVAGVAVIGELRIVDGEGLDQASESFAEISDAAGRGVFEFGLSAGESAMLRLLASDDTSSVAVVVTLVTGERREAELVLRATASVRGRVLLALGEVPVRGATVKARHGGRDVTVRADEDGVFELAHLVAGDVDLEVRAPYRGARRSIVLEAGESRDDVIVELSPIRQIRVVAIDADDQTPVSGAQVHGPFISPELDTLYLPLRALVDIEVSAPRYSTSRIHVDETRLKGDRLVVSLRRLGR